MVDSRLAKKGKWPSLKTAGKVVCALKGIVLRGIRGKGGVLAHNRGKQPWSRDQYAPFFEAKVPRVGKEKANDTGCWLGDRPPGWKPHLQGE